MSQSTMSPEALADSRGTGKELPVDQIAQGALATATGTPNMVINVSAGIVNERKSETGNYRRPAHIGYGIGRYRRDVAPGTVTAVAGAGTTARVATVFITKATGALSISHAEVADVADASDLAALKHPQPTSAQLVVCHVGTQAAPILAATTAITDAMIDNSVRVGS